MCSGYFSDSYLWSILVPEIGKYMTANSGRDQVALALERWKGVVIVNSQGLVNK